VCGVSLEDGDGRATRTSTDSCGLLDRLGSTRDLARSGVCAIARPNLPIVGLSGSARQSGGAPGRVICGRMGRAAHAMRSPSPYSSDSSRHRARSPSSAVVGDPSRRRLSSTSGVVVATRLTRVSMLRSHVLRFSQRPSPTFNRVRPCLERLFRSSVHEGFTFSALRLH